MATPGAANTSAGITISAFSAVANQQLLAQFFI
jgi:hypothetical protein